MVGSIGNLLYIITILGMIIEYNKFDFFIIYMMENI